MSEALAAVLAYAVGVGISPIPIIAVILMLLSRRASVNGPLFLVGWIAGLVGLFAVILAIARAFDVGSSEKADDGVAWLRVALGAALLVLAARKWRKRPKAGEEAPMPGWMASIEEISPPRAAGLALILSLNPKNLMLGIGAATSLAQLDTTTGQTVMAGAAFALIGSAIAIIAVAYHAIGGERARSSLEDLKVWMAANNSAVMMVLFAVFGAVLISQGLGLR